MKPDLKENAKKTTIAKALRMKISFAITRINAEISHFGMKLYDENRVSAYGRAHVHQTLTARARETG